VLYQLSYTPICDYYNCKGSNLIGLGHLWRPRNFTIGNKLPSEGFLAKCFIALLTYDTRFWRPVLYHPPAGGELHPFNIISLQFTEIRRNSIGSNSYSYEHFSARLQYTVKIWYKYKSW
jgi:hypothetical protein